MKHYSRVRLSDHKVTIGGDHDACFSLLVGRLLHSLQHTPWNTRRPLELWLVIPIGHRVGRAVLDPVTLLPTTMADVPWTRRLMRSRTGKSTTSRGAAASASEAAGAAESTTIGRLRHLILLLAPLLCCGLEHGSNLRRFIVSALCLCGEGGRSHRVGRGHTTRPRRGTCIATIKPHRHLSSICAGCRASRRA